MVARGGGLTRVILVAAGANDYSRHCRHFLSSCFPLPTVFPASKHCGRLPVTAIQRKSYGTRLERRYKRVSPLLPLRACVFICTCVCLWSTISLSLSFSPFFLFSSFNKSPRTKSTRILILTTYPL